MDRPTINTVLIISALTVCMIGPARSQSDETVFIKRKPVPVATVRDAETIQFFLDEFFLPETKVDSMDFIDVTGDGFNEKDVLQVYPSREVYNLAPSEAAMAVMRQWKPTQVRVIGEKNEHDQIVVKSEYPAAEAMFAGLVRLIENNYVGKKISLMFEYDGDARLADLIVWGYEEKDLKEPSNPLEQFAKDLMFYVRYDTVYVEKPVYDIIYIEHSVSDSVAITHGGE